MNCDIDAIFLDVGNTLRILVKDESYQAQARQQLAEVAGVREPAETFFRRLEGRYKIYRMWAFETMLEACENELWTRWMMPDYPAERIGPRAGELTCLYRQSMGRRVLQRNGKEVVAELSRRGYCLGIISNVITEREIPEWLDADGLTPYFQSVLLSSVFGRRKPDPAIYWEAARRAGVAPERSAYVGDNPSRDVLGTRRAGFGLVVIMMDPAGLEKEPPTRENMPDLIIHEFSDLLQVFPGRPVAYQGNGSGA